jgi:hypothetical protein
MSPPRGYPLCSVRTLADRRQLLRTCPPSCCCCGRAERLARCPPSPPTPGSSAWPVAGGPSSWGKPPPAQPPWNPSDQTLGRDSLPITFQGGDLVVGEAVGTDHPSACVPHPEASSVVTPLLHLGLTGTTSCLVCIHFCTPRCGCGCSWLLKALPG